MSKKYVYKVNATGEVFNDLQSAVNAAAVDLYRRNRFTNQRMSDPIAVKRFGGYAVHAFNLEGTCYTTNIDVFVPTVFTKKGKQIKVDGLNGDVYDKYTQLAKSCKWGVPDTQPEPVEAVLEIYDLDEDDEDEDELD